MEKCIDEDAFARLYSEFACLLTDGIAPPTDSLPAIKAIDGKFMRGTTLANGRWPGIVSIYDVGRGMTADDESHSVETDHGRIHERRCRVFYGVDRISGIDKFRGVCAVVEVTTHTTYKATGEACHHSIHGTKETA